MRDLLARFSQLLHKKLRTGGFAAPSLRVIRALVDAAYLASLRTEEGRFPRGSITFANPQKPEFDPPIIRRADYPSFTAFVHGMPLTAELLVKLSRAVDKWSGSLAVYGTTSSNIVVWGIVDQVVHHNISLNQEPGGGAPTPGDLTISVDAVGELSAYQSRLFLGSLRRDSIVSQENDAFGSRAVALRILPHFDGYADQISRVLDQPRARAMLLGTMFLKLG
ncbi:MAG: hypothetical protein QM820_23760 [Minicystis sp.]